MVWLMTLSAGALLSSGSSQGAIGPLVGSPTKDNRSPIISLYGVPLGYFLLCPIADLVSRFHWSDIVRLTIDMFSSAMTSAVSTMKVPIGTIIA